MFGKYESLLDADLRAFIEESNAAFPSQLMSLPLHVQRSAYDAMCRIFRAMPEGGLETGETFIHTDGGPLALRSYVPTDRKAKTVLLYFHGGGFVFGSLESHDDICADLCVDAGVEVISVDYRLAPEHRHPAAHDDAVAAWNWISAQERRPIVLIGESAGAGLAAALSHATRSKGVRPAAQILIYPSLGGHGKETSFTTHSNAPLLSAADVEHYRSIRYRCAEDADEPYVNPLRDNNFANLPPTWLFAAEFDPLSGEAETYGANIRRFGGTARCEVEGGLVHGYLRARRRVARAAAAFDRIIKAVRLAGGGTA